MKTITIENCPGIPSIVYNFELEKISAMKGMWMLVEGMDLIGDFVNKFDYHKDGISLADDIDELVKTQKVDLDIYAEEGLYAMMLGLIMLNTKHAPAETKEDRLRLMYEVLYINAEAKKMDMEKLDELITRWFDMKVKYVSEEEVNARWERENPDHNIAKLNFDLTA